MIFCFSPPDFKHHVQLSCALMMNGDVIEIRYFVGTAGSRGVIDNTCASVGEGRDYRQENVG